MYPILALYGFYLTSPLIPGDFSFKCTSEAMVKRAVTPPPGEDEPKYVTVVHPYPLHGNWELEKDRADFARWFACFVDQDAFYGFFHKPASLNMIIAEIRKDYGGFENVLGEHRWKDFLKKPDEEEKAKVTKIYYCTHSTYRQVQKNGWKRIEIESSWFEDWSANNQRMVCPYPKTHWCSVPPEDSTNAPLCRPLPNNTFVPPKPSPAPVVGSEVWMTSKGSGPKPTRATGVWSKGPNMAVTSRGRKANRGKNLSNQAPHPHAIAIVNPASVTSYTASTSPTYGPASSSSSVSGGSSPISPPPFPPGLGIQPTRPPLTGAWGKPLHVPSTSSTVSRPSPGLHRSDNVDCTSTATTAFYEDVMNHGPPIGGIPVQASHSMQDSLSNLYLDEPECVEDVANDLEPAASWEQRDFTQIQKKTEVPAIVCTLHGKICKKGICAVMSKLERDAERKRRQEEAANSVDRGGPTERGKKRRNGKARGGAAREGQRDKNDVGSNTSAKNEQTRTPQPAWSSKNSFAVADDDESLLISGEGIDRASTPSSEHDEEESVADSEDTNGGWGKISNGPW